ncbi:Transferase [Sesbania bispinosa]|nr:Transferase [Sesbania bispinosa]
MILVHYYPIAGRVCWAEGGRIEFDCNAKGAILLEAETTKTLTDHEDFSPSESTKELVPTIDYNQPMEELPLLAVQLTRFHGNEGLAIGVAYFHPLSDATVERNKKITAASLRLTAEQVEKLKKKANEQAPKQGSRPYSKYEVIGAHIWRCASKARELDENQPSVVRFHVDIRNRMVPPLPQNYFGNALAQTWARGYVGDITLKPLNYVAQKIREATKQVSDEYIRSQLDVIRGQEHLDDARALCIEGKNASFCGNPNFHLTSWMSMPVYEADFGWGKPVYFGLAYVAAHDRALILLSPEGDGSVIVCLHFQVAHIQLFKTLFYDI